MHTQMEHNKRELETEREGERDGGGSVGPCDTIDVVGMVVSFTARRLA